MKQASSGGEIYKLGHRIIILKPLTINLSQESPNKSIKIVMLDVIFIKNTVILDVIPEKVISGVTPQK